jgi:microcystin-dependent protein
MGRCSGSQCACVVTAGDNVTVTGSGTTTDPYVITSAGTGGGSGGFLPGDLKDTAAATTPPGWLECNGQSVSRLAFANLFAAIGTTWGAGDGVNTFNVPNTAGRVRVGAGGTFSLGQGGGQNTVTLTLDHLPTHSHDLADHRHVMTHNHGPTSSIEQGHRHDVAYQAQAFRFGIDLQATNQTLVTVLPGSGNHTGTTSVVTQGHNHTTQDYPGQTGIAAGLSGQTGNGQPFNLMPAYRVFRTLIKT